MEIQRLTYYQEDGMANDDDGEYVRYDDVVELLMLTKRRIERLEMVLAAIPPCDTQHAVSCIKHAIQWIEKAKANG
jgi:hypothetical protein